MRDQRVRIPDGTPDLTNVRSRAWAAPRFGWLPLALAIGSVAWLGGCASHEHVDGAAHVDGPVQPHDHDDGDAVHMHADGTVHSHAAPSVADPSVAAGAVAADDDHGHAHDHDHAHHDHGHDHPHDHADATEDAHAAMHPQSDPAAPCTCAKAQSSDGWCRRCNAGYVASVRIESAMLFSALDPHGHELVIASLPCATCAQAAARDGYCESCGIGFVRNQAYFTRLTWGLAQGETVDVTTLTCATCRGGTSSPEWCEACDRGVVGHVAIDDRAAYDRTVAEYATLLAAVHRAPECELCACAMVVHRTCPKCLISYGQP